MKGLLIYKNENNLQMGRGILHVPGHTVHRYPAGMRTGSDR